METIGMPHQIDEIVDALVGDVGIVQASHILQMYQRDIIKVRDGRGDQMWYPYIIKNLDTYFNQRGVLNAS